MQYKAILDFNFIIDCLRQGVLLAIETYTLAVDKTDQDSYS
jgi:hypothetical protein